MFILLFYFKKSKIPSKFDFGFAPVNKMSMLNFEIINRSFHAISFRWEYGFPYAIIPSEGEV